jgi:tetratricopeptide (TPR) repeat protein
MRDAMDDRHSATGRVGRVGRCAAALLVALATTVASARAQTDTVETVDGKSLSGKVLLEAYDHLELQSKQGQKQKLDWSEVATVQYGGSPEYTDAVGKLATAPVPDSLAALEKLKGDAKLRPVVKQQVLFLIASLHVRAGDFDGAATAWQELAKAFPSGRYLDQAARGVAAAYVSKGAPGEASAALDVVVAAAKPANPGPRFDTTVTLVKAWLLETQGNAAGAKSAYEAAEKAGGLAPDQAATTSLGIARCQQKAGQVDDAAARFRKLVNAADTPHAVMAAAWNGIGDLLLEQGRKKRDVEVLTQALYAFLRPVVLYVPLEGESEDDQQHAIAGAADACQSIAELDASLKQAYGQRAADLRTRLKKKEGNARQ